MSCREYTHIPLTQGLCVMVDSEDAQALLHMKWRVLKSTRKSCDYAVRTEGPRGGQRTVYMHKLLLPEAPRVDHINGDGLDNRRANLRAVTQTQNNRNSWRKADNKASRFKGVSWVPRSSKWRARIVIASKHELSLGCFATEEAAARAYDAAALKYFGEYAATNAMAGRL